MGVPFAVWDMSPLSHLGNILPCFNDYLVRLSVLSSFMLILERLSSAWPSLNPSRGRLALILNLSGNLVIHAHCSGPLNTFFMQFVMIDLHVWRCFDLLACYDTII